MPNLDLQPGVVFQRTIVVEEGFTGLALSRSIVGFADMPPVLSTAFMVGLIECTCIEGLRPYLMEDEHTVGTLIDVSHVSSTPVGMRVTAGQAVCIIEAMKIMNEIEAELAGVVREVLVDDAQPVEFGQVPFRVDPHG